MAIRAAKLLLLLLLQLVEFQFEEDLAVREPFRWWLSTFLSRTPSHPLRSCRSTGRARPPLAGDPPAGLHEQLVEHNLRHGSADPTLQNWQRQICKNTSWAGCRFSTNRVPADLGLFWPTSTFWGPLRSCSASGRYRRKQCRQNQLGKILLR